MFDLTPREQEVLALIVNGKSTKQTAFELGIAFRTAVCHRCRILKKLNVHNTAELIVKAVQLGLVEVSEKPEKSAPTTVDECRDQLKEARLRLHSASELTRKAWEQFKAHELPPPDGSFAYEKALREEVRALAEFKRILRTHAELSRDVNVHSANDDRPLASSNCASSGKDGSPDTTSAR